MQSNSDMTLYQRSVVAGAEAWTRVQVLAVFWENRKAANVLRSGLLEADKVAVYIPLARAVTIQVGDVLVKGLVTDTVNSSTFTMSDLKKKYADVVTVRSVDTMDYGSAALQHIQVGAS